MYLSEKIGNEYQNWNPGDVVLITAPTGAGKSYFIQHVLLKWMIKNQRGKIFYLVNRKILKKQMLKDLRNTYYDIYEELMEEGIKIDSLENHIKYETYQHIETLVSDGNINEILRLTAECSVVVYDECHYFYSDSTFNTRTELSYNCLRQIFDLGIQIYMSATMEIMEKRIKKDCLEDAYLPQEIPNRYSAFRTKRPQQIKEGYNLEKNYDYVNTRLLNTPKDLIDEIQMNIKEKKKKEKWLVFIDKIELGKRIKSELCQNDDKDELLNKDEVIVIDASYGGDEETEVEVNSIAENSCSDKIVIITTPVMDNGVSIYDVSLKNIVIMTDTQESFIQMLGRKRTQEVVNL